MGRGSRSRPAHGQRFNRRCWPMKNSCCCLQRCPDWGCPSILLALILFSHAVLILYFNSSLRGSCSHVGEPEWYPEESRVGVEGLPKEKDSLSPRPLCEGSSFLLLCLTVKARRPQESKLCEMRLKKRGQRVGFICFEPNRQKEFSSSDRAAGYWPESGIPERRVCPIVVNTTGITVGN